MIQRRTAHANGTPGSANTTLTLGSPPVRSFDVMPKTRMAGIRANDKMLTSWARKAKAAGMSLNKWACLVLNSAPKVKPAAIIEVARSRK